MPQIYSLPDFCLYSLSGKMTNSRTIDAKPKSISNDGKDLKVSFRLPVPYSDRVRLAAKTSQSRTNEIARQLLVATLENPSRESLLQELSVVAEKTEHLRYEISVLHNEIEGLRLATYLTTELLLVLIGGLSPEEAHQVMEEVLAEGES